MSDDDRYRLPRVVAPRRYRLAIAADLANSTFEGTTVVDLIVREPVTSITCNAADLAVHSAVLTDAGGGTRVGSIHLDADTERVRVEFEEEIPAGDATITFTQSGTLNDKLQGFYRSTFTDADGNERVIATTQFEATDARRAFPCWDEPEAKATFEIELLVPDGMTALSNTAPVAERPAGETGRWVRFAPTMVMSTYLAAWVIGPLELTEAVDVDGVPLRVACPPSRSHLARFALEVGAHALRYFSDYFNIPYPGDKLDFVAIPDFAFGAMENLGCVTFRETAVLVDPDHASREELARIVDVVSHEVAHMWFGDLVTMKWWNGIWLNEAFATFMEVHCADAFRPDWDRWTEFSSGRAQAMAVDGLVSTRPIEFPVVSPDEAEGMFDLLTYEKGGAVLRMLETYLGPERFRDGIRHYLRIHSFANTETTDLWDALEHTTGEPVRSIMDTWIFQGGHPEVRVEASAPDRAGRLSISQRRFRYTASDDDAAVRWQIPLLLRVSTPERSTPERSTPERWSHQRLLLDEPEASIDLPEGSGTVVANDGGWGFFRTRYDSDLLARLTADLDALSAIERFNLVSDTWSFVLAGRTPLADYCTLVSALTDERDETVWGAALAPLDMLDRIATDADRAAVAAFVRMLVTPAFSRLGWEPRPDDGPRTGTLRASLLSALGTIGADDQVRNRVAELHADYLKDRSTVPPDLIGAVVEVMAWIGGEADYERFWERSRHAPTPQEEVRYLYALPRFGSPELMERTLSLALSEIRTQNAPFVVGTALTNRACGPQAWAWLKQHWDEVVQRFPDSTIWRMLEGVATLTTPELVSDVHAFVDAHPLANAQRLVEQTLERLDVAASLRRREAATLGEVLGSFTT